jgi:hypothetical protein
MLLPRQSNYHEKQKPRSFWQSSRWCTAGKPDFEMLQKNGPFFRIRGRMYGSDIHIMA